ncbi:MAG TPA: DUF1697 domain-containing protein [Candidatus Saccharimonadales bacterium]|nr:DUF1697 domain-containing protein [Candidatus Saccharimonadales bacterium]
MHTYVAFLRGVNVGGNGLIKMSELKDALAAHGFQDVRTYIASGNVIFSSESGDKDALTKSVASVIEKTFSLNVSVAIFRADDWKQVIKAAPPWWGKDKTWRHNIFILIEPYEIAKLVTTIGTLRTGMEKLKVGDGVLYQSIAIEAIGKGVTGSKLIANSAYKQISIRNYNTARKLAELL